MATLHQTFFTTAERNGDRAALRVKRDGRYRSLTYGCLADGVRQFAAALQQLGFTPGERVAIVAPNGPAWVIADLGTMAAGGVTVPVHGSFSPELIRHVISHAGCRVLVVASADLIGKLAAVAGKLPGLAHVVVVGAEPVAVGQSQVHSWEQFLASGGTLQQPTMQGSEPASIVYTSGTTGLPKGVVLSHANFLSNVQASLQAVPVLPSDIFLSFLPLSHVLERMAGYYAPLTQGAEIAYAENPATLRDNLREVRPTILIAVPRIFEKFHDGVWSKVNASAPWRRRLFMWALKQQRGTWQHRLADRAVFAKIRHALGGWLRLAISGGASLHPPLAKFFDRLGVLILEGYGLTETSPVITVNTELQRRIGSVGKPLPGVEVKIASDKEILARGPNVCLGYWQDETSSRELIDADGWLHTGDLGFIDADGFLFVTGRSKEMLVTAGGKNIWPAVVENAINSDQLVAQSMIIAHKRPCVVALIVPAWPAFLAEAAKHGWPENRQALCAHPGAIAFMLVRIVHAMHHLPDYEHVRKIALLPEEFSADRDEVTPTLKLRRSVIERHYAIAISALYGR